MEDERKKLMVMMKLLRMFVETYGEMMMKTRTVVVEKSFVVVQKGVHQR